MEQTSAQIELGNVVVTGGLGFIGSHFVRHALFSNSCNSLINIDYAGYGSNQNNLRDIVGNAKYRYINADINNRKALKPIFEKEEISVVVNFAAETHVDRSIADPVSFVHSNVNGVLSLLELCRLYDVKRFIQISTDEVYGDATGQGYIDEEYPPRPNSPYSASKAAADMLVRAYNKTYGMDTRITRCSNNFGPNQFPEKLMPKTVIRSLKGLTIPVYGDGKQVREWIYVEDHIQGIMRVIETDGKAGEIYNISSSIEITNIEIVNKIISMLQSKLPSLKPKVEHVPDRPGHDRRYSLDSSKIRRELGWSPLYSFDTALEQTLTWYLENESWWKPLINDGSILHPQPWTLNWKH